MEPEALRCALMGVSAYQNIADLPLMRLAREMLDGICAGEGERALEAYGRLFFTLSGEGAAGLGEWLCDRLRYEESPYPLALERGRCSQALEGAARRDIERFRALAEADCGELLARIAALVPDGLKETAAGLPRWESGAVFTFESLRDFYLEKGCGLFARYRAFLWEGGALTGVAYPDSPAQEELLGYERQRGQVIANTRAMLAGHRVNNVLLYGDSGTGKSATVKSLLHIPEFADLRLIEVEKGALAGLSGLIRTLGGRRWKFILFIDDLAFDQDDRTYSDLKTILEGGLEPRPANVAVYATSNRRHLVRQTFSDRAGDEVDAVETIAEKTALSDRFGLRIPYLGLARSEYLALVDHLAKLSGVDMPAQQLHAAAAQWEVRHAGRTPRSARQFISSLSL